MDGKQVIVCKRAFASLYGVSMNAVSRIAQATPTSVVAPRHMQGRHKNRPLKITPTIHKQVTEHIKSFPVMK